MSVHALVRTLAVLPIVLFPTMVLTACDDDAQTPAEDALGDTLSDGADTALDGMQPCGGCMPGLHCEPARSACQECVDDTHCANSPNGDVCAEGLCVVPECDGDDDCGIGEACLGRRCQTADVACSTSLDCPVEQPACISLGADTSVCRAFAECLDDDGGDGDDGDDGPSAARILDVASGQTVTATARICSAPSTEVDTWRFTADHGDRITLVVTPSRPDADIDIEVYDSRLVGYGASFWRNPEVIDLGYLPAGDYFLEVSLYTGDQPQRDTVAYTVELTRTPGACDTTTDCTALWDSASMRSQCGSDGACRPLTTSTPRAEGEHCDSGDDCDSQLCAGKISTVVSLGQVLYDFFAHAERRAVCTRQCSFDGQCAAGMLCEPQTGLCALPCESNDECPVYSTLPPDPGDAWRHMTCDTDSGRCLALDPSVEPTVPSSGDDVLTVETLASHGPGVVTVRADDGAGTPGVLLGFAYVTSGRHQDVHIALSRPLNRGERVHLALHRDLDPVGTYDETSDPIATRITAEPVVVTVTVP